jgi:hypothetical protein
MNTVAIDYIWQAILESERSDEIQLVSNELRMDDASALRRADKPQGTAGLPRLDVVQTLTDFSALC